MELARENPPVVVRQPVSHRRSLRIARDLINWRSPEIAAGSLKHPSMFIADACIIAPSPYHIPDEGNKSGPFG